MLIRTGPAGDSVELPYIDPTRRRVSDSYRSSRSRADFGGDYEDALALVGAWRRASHEGLGSLLLLEPQRGAKTSRKRATLSSTLALVAEPVQRATGLSTDTWVLLFRDGKLFVFEAVQSVRYTPPEKCSRAEAATW